MLCDTFWPDLGVLIENAEDHVVTAGVANIKLLLKYPLPVFDNKTLETCDGLNNQSREFIRESEIKYREMISDYMIKTSDSETDDEKQSDPGAYEKCRDDENCVIAPMLVDSAVSNELWPIGCLTTGEGNLAKCGNFDTNNNNTSCCSLKSNDDTLYCPKNKLVKTRSVLRKWVAKHDRARMPVGNNFKSVKRITSFCVTITHLTDSNTNGLVRVAEQRETSSKNSKAHFVTHKRRKRSSMTNLLSYYLHGGPATPFYSDEKLKKFKKAENIKIEELKEMVSKNENVILQMSTNENQAEELSKKVCKITEQLSVNILLNELKIAQDRLFEESSNLIESCEVSGKTPMMVPPALLERWCQSLSTSETCLSLNVRALTSCKLAGISLHDAHVIIHLSLHLDVPVNEELSIYKVTTIPTYEKVKELRVREQVAPEIENKEESEISEKEKITKKLIEKLLNRKRRGIDVKHNIFRTKEVLLPKILATDNDVSLKLPNTKVLVFENCLKSGQIFICKVEEASPKKSCAKAVIAATTREKEHDILGQCQIVKTTTSVPCEVRSLRNGYFVSTKDDIPILNKDSKVNSIFESENLSQNMCHEVCTVTAQESERMFYCRDQRYLVKKLETTYEMTVDTRELHIDLSELKESNEHDIDFSPLGLDLLDRQVNFKTAKIIFVRLIAVSFAVFYICIFVFICAKCVTQSRRCGPVRRCLRRRHVRLPKLDEKDAFQKEA